MFEHVWMIFATDRMKMVHKDLNPKMTMSFVNLQSNWSDL